MHTDTSINVSGIRLGTPRLQLLEELKRARYSIQEGDSSYIVHSPLGALVEVFFDKGDQVTRIVGTYGAVLNVGIASLATCRRNLTGGDSSNTVYMKLGKPVDAEPGHSAYYSIRKTDVAIEFVNSSLIEEVEIAREAGPGNFTVHKPR